MREGKFFQISVSDPQNKYKFDFTDKILLFKYQGRHYVTGSFCGFDYTDLNDGVFLNNKIICPTCGSAYCITDGLLDNGPTMRSLSTFPTQVRNHKVTTILPEKIPAFSTPKFQDFNPIDPRIMAIVGDTETALNAAISLRMAYAGAIKIFTTSPYGEFQNKDVLYRKMGEIEQNEIYYMSEIFQRS